MHSSMVVLRHHLDDRRSTQPLNQFLKLKRGCPTVPRDIGQLSSRAEGKAGVLWGKLQGTRVLPCLIFKRRNPTRRAEVNFCDVLVLDSARLPAVVAVVQVPEHRQRLSVLRPTATEKHRLSRVSETRLLRGRPQTPTEDRVLFACDKGSCTSGYNIIAVRCSYSCGWKCISNRTRDGCSLHVRPNTRPRQLTLRHCLEEGNRLAPENTRCRKFLDGQLHQGCCCTTSPVKHF